MTISAIAKASFEQFSDALMPLEGVINRLTVSEIMVNHADSVFVQENGVMEETGIKINPKMVRAAIKYLSSGLGQGEAIPGTDTGIVHAAYENLRIAAVMAPTAIDGDAICIRKHSAKDFTPDDYLNAGSFDLNKVETEKQKLVSSVIEPFAGMDNAVLLKFIEQEIRNKKTFLIGGGTDAGKTALLNMFLKYFPVEQRIITLEDTEELKVRNPNKVRLLSNKSQGVTMKLLIELCLRFRPDRMIMGELRSGEALDFVDALNTGHDGGVASLHAKNALLCLTRLESLVRRGMTSSVDTPMSEVRRDIADCVDYVLYFKKSPHSSFRFLSDMIRVDGLDQNEYAITRIFN